MSDKKKKQSRLKELEAENRRLKAENDMLRHELTRVSKKKIFNDSQDVFLQSFEKRAESAQLFSKKRYTAYLASLIAGTSGFKLYKRIIGLLKKYTLVTVSLQLAAYILLAIQSSAGFVLALSISIILVPLTFIFGYSSTLFTLFSRKRAIKRVEKMTNGKPIVIYFAPRKNALPPSSFFVGSVRDWIDRKGGVAVIVSPYFFSPKGFSRSRRSYFLMRTEDEDVIVIRRHFFFTLKKRIFDSPDKDVTMIY